MMTKKLEALKRRYEQVRQVRDDCYKAYEHAQALFLNVRDVYKQEWEYENRGNFLNPMYDFPPE